MEIKYYMYHMGLDARGVCEHHRCRPACASAQSDQRLCYSLFICKLATGEISVFLLVSVAEKTGLKFALSDTMKTGFLATRPIYFVYYISKVVW